MVVGGEGRRLEEEEGVNVEEGLLHRLREAGNQGRVGCSEVWDRRGLTGVPGSCGVLEEHLRAGVVGGLG